MNTPDLATIQSLLPAIMFASIRPGAALIAVPVFGSAQVPIIVRFMIALAIGIQSTPISHATALAEELSGNGGLVIIAREIVVGLALGFAVQTGFAAASIAGELAGNAMGFGLASVVNPLSGSGSPILAHAMSVFATLVFLATDGHLAFIAVLHDTYSVLPIDGGGLPPQGFASIVMLGGAMFAAGMVIAAPVVLGVVVVQLVMAILARSAPALNLFAVGLPAAALAGLALLAMSLPSMGEAIARSLTASIEAARTPW